MSNSALDHQIQIGLRDDRAAEKFAEQMAELAAQIVNSTFKLAHDVKSAYESDLIPKKRQGDRNFDETDQARLALGAFAFFMHVLDRQLLRMDTHIMRNAVFDFMFENVVQQVYANSFTGPAAQAEKFILDYYDRRTSQLAEAPTVGETPEDGNTALSRAALAICEEDLGRADRRLVAIVGTHLMQGLGSLALADQITAMAEVLCLPSHLRKTA